MLKRILTSIWALAILFFVLLFSETVVFPIAVAVVTLFCLFEMFRCMQLEKKLALGVPAYLIAIAAPFLLRSPLPLAKSTVILTVCAVLYLIYTFALIIWSHGSLPFEKVAATYMINLYIVFAMNFILYVRDFGDKGKYIYLLIFLGAWITDTFAYFTGRLFGKHKLIEDVSPKKTIEGSIGGILFCCITFLIFGWSIGQISYWWRWLISGLFISIISQIGDLILSVIKRHYGIKDYGSVFPGHGGMLDRFDSILAVSCGMALLCMLVKISGLSVF